MSKSSEARTESAQAVTKPRLMNAYQFLQREKQDRAVEVLLTALYRGKAFTIEKWRELAVSVLNEKV